MEERIEKKGFGGNNQEKNHQANHVLNTLFVHAYKYVDSTIAYSTLLGLNMRLL